MRKVQHHSLCLSQRCLSLQELLHPSTQWHQLITLPQSLHLFSSIDHNFGKQIPFDKSGIRKTVELPQSASSCQDIVRIDQEPRFHHSRGVKCPTFRSDLQGNRAFLVCHRGCLGSHSLAKAKQACSLLFVLFSGLFLQIE